MEIGLYNSFDNQDELNEMSIPIFLKKKKEKKKKERKLTYFLIFP